MSKNKKENPAPMEEQEKQTQEQPAEVTEEYRPEAEETFTVTREQMVVFFARFAQLNGQTVEAKGDLSNYHDASAISNYAKESMAWAVETGLIQGITSTTLSPKTTSTRAQIAEVLLRYCTTFGSSQTSSTSNPLIG